MFSWLRLKVWLLAAVGLSVIAQLVNEGAADDGKRLQAGAAAVDITPTRVPVIVNGYFNERTADRVHDRLKARALVLDDGSTRLAIMVVDTLMIERQLLDRVKRMARQATGIAEDHMLISATHTHSAPSVMGCLGSGADEAYCQWLPSRLAETIAQAARRLRPARIGWAVVQDPEHNHCRRWIFRPDRMRTDPFGQRNVRAHMHPGYQSPNHIGPAGPADTGLTLLSVQTADGKPLAVLANYAMHYYGSTPLSADFCGRFGDKLAALIRAADSDPPFVGMMSQGTSGDSMWMDYSRPAPKRDLDAYAEAVARVAKKAYEQIEYHDWVPLGMCQRTLKLRRRVPDNKRLAWAREILAGLKRRAPRGLPEIYAREQIYLHEQPEVELELQAVRIGQLGITAIPNEVFGITGLKLKAQSPLVPTFNIELANGAFGYIPPPEQHALGGYTTWAARTAGLEVQAEPKIVSALLEMLEKLAGKPRREVVEPTADYVTAVLASRPIAYWRLGEMEGFQATDAIGKHQGTYEKGVVFYLPGPPIEGTGPRPVLRAAHFAGGRVKARVKELGDTYSVELWFWNGLPSDARAVTGYFFSRGPDGDKAAPGDHLGIGGTHREGLAGKLIFFNGNVRKELLVGRTAIKLRTWQHVVLTRDGAKVNVYLNGTRRPEISGTASITCGDGGDQLFLGGRSDRLFNFEGKLDEAALYDRVLSADEVAAHFAAAGVRNATREGEAPAEPKAAARSKPVAKPNALAAKSTASRSEPAVRPAPEPDSPPLSPSDGLASVHVRDGFRVELVAAEPLVIDPVAIDWGPDGKLWVVEMADYPLGMDGQGKPGGRIRCVEDTDGDGKYDKSTVFLDGVNFPTGVLPWKQGVLVTAAPEIFYAEDTDGDGKADVRQALYTGFFEGNQQLRVNGLRWGLDNWVHCAIGSHHSGYAAGTQIRSTRSGELFRLGARDFRILPDRGQLDPLSGPSQFGRNRDDWGNWFGVQNSYPLWHYVLEDRYMRRNPHIAPPDPRKQLLLPPNPKVYPVKPPQKRFHSFEQAGHFTSACGAMIYRDELLFGRDGRQHAFTCEPVHNLVHHAVLTEDGVSFAARRADAEQQSEFFASEDRWCRPVLVRTGPDGALWVVDMYRYMIEHPQWLPPAGKDELRPFYRSGDDRGRIYRVYPADKRPRPIPRLDRLDTRQLVAAFQSPNGWQRDTAQRLLIERNDKAAAALLEHMAGEGEKPLARLHALCTLDGLGALRPELIERALADPHPAVRRHAVRLAEPRASDAPQLISSVLRLVTDRDAKVRLQVACTLGQWRDPRIGPALGRLLLDPAGDPYLTAAAMSSLNETNVSAALEAVAAACSDRQAARQRIGPLLAVAAAFGQDRAMAEALAQVAAPTRGSLAAWQFVAAADLLDALARRRKPLQTLLGKQAYGQVDKLIAAARRCVMESERDESARRAAVRLMGRQPQRRAQDIEALGELLVPQTPPGIQEAIVAHLGRQSGRHVAEVLLAGWKSHGPALRAQILSVLPSRRPWIEVLLENMENGRVRPGEIDAATRARLARRKEADLRSRLEKQLSLSGAADRQKVLARFQPTLNMHGDVQHGAELFKSKCATCHKQGDVGYEVGPKLVALTSRTPEALLTSILDPSQAVDPRYVNYIALTDDGLTHSGILSSETGVSITLLGPEARQQVILRNELEELQSTGKSLMPDGLEKDLTPQDLADLIAFVIETLR